MDPCLILHYFRKLLFQYTSPPLSEIIYHTNQKSNNLYAETLLKTTGKVILNDGSTSSGIKAVENYWTGKGINLIGFNMEDGSGLSRLNYWCKYASRWKNFRKKWFHV